MKKLIILLSLFFLVCCSLQRNKLVYVEFTHDKELDNHGLSADSTIGYFPKKLFTDTVVCYMTPSGHIYDSKYYDKESHLLISRGTLDDLKDTFKIETDSSYFRETSYMLFKMKEPVLSDRYWGKEAYRIIGLRSFHRPIVIRIEKNRGEITMYAKELNRHITYPYFRLLENFVMFDPPVIKGVRQERNDKERYERAKRENDSLCRLYNNTNYHLTLNDETEVLPSVWDSLEVLVDSAKFWQSKPELFLNNVQVDGSIWYLEGHFKYGYQLKRIPSPHFIPHRYPHNYDKNDYYARLINYLVGNTTLRNEELY